MIVNVSLLFNCTPSGVIHLQVNSENVYWNVEDGCLWEYLYIKYFPEFQFIPIGWETFDKHQCRPLTCNEPWKRMVLFDNGGYSKKSLRGKIYAHMVHHRLVSSECLYIQNTKCLQAEIFIQLGCLIPDVM